MEEVARALRDVRDCLYLGRGIHRPNGLRGCTEAEGDSLHPCEKPTPPARDTGPIALINKRMRVLCLAPKNPLHGKMISQIQQAKGTRQYGVIAVATDGDVDTSP